MKKILFVSLVSFVVLLCVAFLGFSQPTQASSCVGVNQPDAPQVTSIVQCGQFPQCQCDIPDFFQMMFRIYQFVIYFVALPIAGLVIVLSGVLLVVSAGRPGMAGTAKNMLKFAAIGCALVFGSYLIIDFVLRAIGYAGPWNQF